MLYLASIPATVTNAQFQAGDTRLHHDGWKCLTSDRFILQTVAGATLEFDANPVQLSQPRTIKFSDYEFNGIDDQITKFLKSGIIERATHCNGEFVSNIFARDKKDGSLRVILNLIDLNQFITYHHFKMDTIDTVINLMRTNCFMGSIDLSNAYFSIPVLQAHRRFLRFKWRDCLFQFCVLPNGLSSGPRVFTKVLKPVYAHLRQLGHITAGYIDDSFIMASSYDECMNSVDFTENLFKSLGFYINVNKSVTTPTQELEHLGFLLNSVNMTVTLTKRKVDNLICKCKQILSESAPTIRSVAELIGLMVSSFTGVEFGRLHYRFIELDKVQALKVALGDFDKSVVLSEDARSDVKWWLDNVALEVRHIDHGPYKVFITTDASQLGWGAVLDSHEEAGDEQSTGGRWNVEEQREHINVLELKAGWLGIQTYCSNIESCHVKISMDNTTSVAYINHFGGCRSVRCNAIAQDIWAFCRLRGIWLTAAHLPGHLNVLADERSRLFDDKTEWKLNPCVYKQVVQRFGTPTIDLFASRLNFQLKPFISWVPDPEASFIDAFTIDWSEYMFYAFPPFSILLHVIKKIEYDGATGILIVPNWPTQVWFPLLRRLLLAEPLMLHWRNDIVTLPFRPGPHPLGHKLHLMACLLCGVRSSGEAAQNSLPT